MLLGYLKSEERVILSMNKCVICGKYFEPPKGYKEKLTCTKTCWNEFKRQTVSDKFLKNSFKKGNVPYNKGIPQSEWLSKEAQEKCSKTYIQYQENNISPLSKIEGRYLPHNTNQKGTVTLREHIHKKGKAKGKVEYEYFINIDWRGNRKPNNLYRRYIWEYYHQQDIPKGMVVYAIDGNSANVSIDNLKLISRADLARINKCGRL